MNVSLQLPEKIINLWGAQIAEFVPGGRSIVPTPEVEKTFNENRLVWKNLGKRHADDIRTLWTGFTKDRAKLSRYMHDSKRAASTYLLTNSLPNAARCWGALQRLEERWQIRSHVNKYSHVNIVDLGAGTGTVSASIVCWLNSMLSGRTKIGDVALIDRQKQFLRIAQSTLKSLAPETPIRTIHEDILDQDFKFFPSKNSDPQTTLHIVTIGYLYNEIANKRIFMKRLEALLQKLKNVIVIDLDPANETSARANMEFRDELHNGLGLQVLYPCPHARHCPMLARSKDWCYSEWTWNQPWQQQAIDEATELDRRNIACAAYIFGNVRLQPSSTSTGQTAVIVGAPIKKSRFKPIPDKYVLLCTKAGQIQKLTLEKTDELFDKVKPLRGQYYKKPVPAPGTQKDTPPANWRERPARPSRPESLLPVARDARKQRARRGRGLRSEKFL